MLAGQTDSTARNESSVVYLIENEAALRRALSCLLRPAGLGTQSFGSGDELVNARVDSPPACVVAELLMPDGAGVDLPWRLHESGHDLSAVVLTAAWPGRQGRFCCFASPWMARRWLVRSSGLLTMLPRILRVLIKHCSWTLTDGCAQDLRNTSVTSICFALLDVSGIDRAAPNVRGDLYDYLVYHPSERIPGHA